MINDILINKSYRVRLDKTYFAETENWKHYSKMIFKCVNSAMRPIFNEKVKFVGPVNSARMHCSREKSPMLRLEKKKKKKNETWF